jgi:hypothetical protein
MEKGYTVVQLEKILLQKKAKLESLIQERDRLKKKLAQLEGRIAEIGGIIRDERKPRRSRRRPKNAKTLIEAVAEVLTQHKKGLSLKDLASKVLESGYKTGSANFQNTVYQCLYHNADKLAHDAKTHLYRVK